MDDLLFISFSRQLGSHHLLISGDLPIPLIPLIRKRFFVLNKSLTFSIQVIEMSVAICWLPVSTVSDLQHGQAEG